LCGVSTLGRAQRAARRNNRGDTKTDFIMIFQFPDSDTLRLALTSGLIPPAVSLAPAVGGADDGGRPWVEPSAKPTRGMLAALAKLGVVTEKTYASPGDELVNRLLQLQYLT